MPELLLSLDLVAGDSILVVRLGGRHSGSLDCSLSLLIISLRVSTEKDCEGRFAQ